MLQSISYNYIGENLIFKIRKIFITEVLYKEVAWFDKKDTAPGVLSNILSEDIALLRGLTTETISIYIEGILCIAIAIVISVTYSWRMTLITIALAPFAMASGYLKMMVYKKDSKAVADRKGEDDYNNSNAILSDILINYKTVIGFGP